MLNRDVISKIKAVAFDLDGTIYFGDALAEGVQDLTFFLKGKGIKIFYFSNNSAKSRLEVFNKLKLLGLDVSVDEVYNSAYATAEYLKENNIKSVFCSGSPGLAEEIESRGIKVLRGGEFAEAVVVGLNNKFNYDNISEALNRLKNGSKLIACNRDRNYPASGGRLLPGCGPLVASIESAAGLEADYVVGKPNTYMLSLLAKDHNLKNTEILVVGDTYDSDIVMADRYGSPGVLILNNNSNARGAASVNTTKELKSIFL